MTGRACAAGMAVLTALLLTVRVGSEEVPALIGPTWLLLEAGGVAVTVPAGTRHPYLVFEAAPGKATGYSGCNEYFGSYRLQGDAITLGPLGMTRMSCDGAAGSAESVLMRALGETRSWRIEKGILLLMDRDRLLARFRMKADGSSGR